MTRTEQRVERLLNLTAALLNAEQPLTADQVRERVPGYPDTKPAFRRQFERDKDALRSLGIPLTTVLLPGWEGTDNQAGYRIPPEEYELVDLGLEPDELSALHLAARMINVEGLPGQAATWKLTAGAEAELAAAEIDPLVSGGDLPASEALAELFGAIAAGRHVHFQYRGTARMVEPEQLSFRNGHWYLGGRLHTGHAEPAAAPAADAGEARSFRIDRIEGAIALGVPITGDRREVAATAAFDRPWELGAGPITDVVVRVDADQADWARRHFAVGIPVQPRPDGSVLATLSVRNHDALRSFVLGFLHHAEIVSPEPVRAAFVDWLRALATPPDPQAS